MGRILGLAVAVAAALALTGVAAAATNGTYAGTSSITISGFKATHPFSVTVKKARIVKVELIAGSNCATVDGASGIKAKLAIAKNGHFGGSIKTKTFTLKLQGTFKGKAVSGSFTGTAKGLSSSCPIPKNTFKARR
ncbi:MAG TPA: hypothetical protein VMF14_07375 [Solirubrobacteraceae bacterium]|nr:hypothetical protein [Solirubrobacteraceae bacterium]